MSDSVAIAIVGLGYVGLPLAIQFARSNVNVIGLDVDNTKVDLINKGQSYTKHIQSSTIAKSIMPGDCSISIRETGQSRHLWFAGSIRARSPVPRDERRL